MADSEILTRLVAEAEGAHDLIMIRALVEEASELGAARALERLGLSDPKAPVDVKELRDLLDAWRAAKKSARAAVIGWIVKLAGALMLLGIAAKFNPMGLIR